jgi:hypothetical protein
LVECIEWRGDRAPSSLAPPPVFTDADADRLRKWALGALNNIASRLAATKKGGRNHAINSHTLAGKSWCGLSKQEIRDAMWWACKVNGYLDDPEDGPDAFAATFESDGILESRIGSQVHGCDIWTAKSSST